MNFSREAIIQKLKNLLDIIKKNCGLELEKKSIELYNFHIKSTEEIIQTLESSTVNETNEILASFFESEGRAYGWSFLPNKNGEEAETAFWNLKRELGFNER